MSTIYILKDPRDGQPKFVGRTTRLWKLRKLHPSNWMSSNKLQYNWVKQLIKEGLKPIIEKIEEVPAKEAEWARQMVIKSLINKGIKLLNSEEVEVNRRRSIKQKENLKAS